MALAGESGSAAPAGKRARTGALAQAEAVARNPWTLTALVGVVAAIVLWLLVQPLAGASNDTDAADTVLFFERIVHGHRLEAFVSTTPKPLLTLIYGVAWSLTHDWRTLTELTVGAGAAAVALAARLASRLGGLGAAAIATVAFLAWPDFGLEVARANSFVWGLALWLLAGVLMTADRPRPWPAGLALVLAGLVRTETVWLLGAAFACTVWVGWRARRSGDRSELRRVAPLLIGVLAIPLACLHDLLLTGKPLFWLGVPAGYTAVAYPNLVAVSPLEEIRKEIVYFEPAAALLVLAVIGGIWLLLSRRRSIAFAMASLAGGVLLTLVVLAVRSTYISVRYFEEVDAVVLLAAAVGAAGLIRWPFDRPALQAQRVSPPRRLAPVLVAAVMALGVVAVAVPHNTVDAQTQPGRVAYASLESRLATLAPILAGADGGTRIVKGAGYPVADPATSRVILPRPFLAIVSLELNIPITAVGDSYLAFRDGTYPLKAGQWVLHMSAVDGTGGVYAPFEHDVTTMLVAADGQALALVPVIVDSQNGLWLDRVEGTSAG